jgi:glucose-1-phosphate thymidylyltransferase
LGVPYFDKQGRLIKYVEKPENPPHDFAIPGLYFFDYHVFKCFQGKNKIQPSQRGELEISAPFQWLINHGYRVDVLEYKGVWLDPGKIDDWLWANKWLLEHKLEPKLESKTDSSSKIEEKVKIGKDCQIINSQIKEPSVIGDNVKLENCSIGPYTSISNGCILENCSLENTILMQNSKISQVKQKIIDSLIGADTEIIKSPGSSLSFFIGDKCKIEVQEQ